MSNGDPTKRRQVAPIAVSVIIPAYQAAGFVRSAINSALAQTRKDIEVIVVDDGSSDGTWDKIVACADHDPRVVPLRQPCWAGPSSARNAGILRAQGKWLALLDADDLYSPLRLEHLVAAAEALDADLLADNLLQVDFVTGAQLGNRFRDAVMSADDPVSLIEALRRDMPGPGVLTEMFGFFQPLIRRDFLLAHGISYAEDVLVGEDFLLYFECIARGGRFHLTRAAHYVQRLRSGSHSACREAMLYLSVANRRMLRIAAQLPAPEAVALLRRRQRQIDIDCFALLLERAEVGAALKHAHCGSPARLLRHARAVAGAMRRRFRARVPTVPSAADPAAKKGEPAALTQA
uniref:glycosyltransferase family 2 protein n=1 Tax=uncultured Sphingomonas sp. TaxID=158754 RepID=UPI0025EF7E68|nr:glycosyltransferase family 2 protein [uncultured Sphingomonas sp.]